MKRLVKYSLMVCIALAFTACVKDLNTKPIDPNSSTSFNQDRMFTKCYACLALIGQSGPGEDSDVDWNGLDAGTSGFYRTIWYCNELTTDEAWWIWPNDKEATQLAKANWEGSNVMMGAIYSRLVLDIKYCNHYLTYASENNEEERYRKAEVRFIRALHYYYFMDMFLYVPFATEDSNEFPHFLPRHEVYKWLVSELKDLIGLLPSNRLSKYRVGKAAAQLLLARTYLNADVYNEYNKSWTKNMTATWNKAYDAATAVINDNPQHALVVDSIVTDSGFVYSAYQRLFMGDNHNDEVIKESLLQIYQDGLYAQSYANSIMLVSAPRMAGMNPWGIEVAWQSVRTSPTMVEMFLRPIGESKANAASWVYDEFKMPKKMHDDRAILCSDGLNTGYKYKLTGNQTSGANENLFDCWGALKFTGVYSTASLPKHSPRQSKDWPDTDIPLLRLAEAYMIQAEALLRKGDNAGALAIINNVIRKRANADPLSSIDNDVMLDEWGREFYFEGRRRIDLVRFGRFYGPKADAQNPKYNWEGRAGRNDGVQFFATGTAEHMNWFPIPTKDKRSNPNFKTEVEDDPQNAFASQGGDGFTY